MSIFSNSFNITPEDKLNYNYFLNAISNVYRQDPNNPSISAGINKRVQNQKDVLNLKTQLDASYSKILTEINQNIAQYTSLEQSYNDINNNQIANLNNQINDLQNIINSYNASNQSIIAKYGLDYSGFLYESQIYENELVKYQILQTRNELLLLDIAKMQYQISEVQNDISTVMENSVILNDVNNTIGSSYSQLQHYFNNKVDYVYYDKTQQNIYTQNGVLLNTYPKLIDDYTAFNRNIIYLWDYVDTLKTVNFFLFIFYFLLVFIIIVLLYFNKTGRDIYYRVFFLLFFPLFPLLVHYFWSLWK